MKEQESLGPWICDQCGEPGDDDICLACGNSRPVPAPDWPKPGTYGQFMGWPKDRLSARMWLWAPFMFLVMAIAAIYWSLDCSK